MMPINFTVTAVPVAQPRHMVSTRNGFSQLYLPRKHPVHDFKASCRQAAAAVMDGGPLRGPIGLWVTFVLPRPKGMLYKRKPMPRVRHTVKPDLDNLQKSLKDALKGIVWVDDCQVCEGVYDKVYARGDETPHVEVEVSQLSEVWCE